MIVKAEDHLAWDEQREIDLIAFSIVILKTALTFWGRDPDALLEATTSFDQKYPPTEGEKALVAKWLQYSPTEREDALDRALVHMIGNTLGPLKKDLESNPLSGSSAEKKLASQLRKDVLSKAIKEGLK
jgi:hypothetical protein